MIVTFFITCGALFLATVATLAVRAWQRDTRKEAPVEKEVIVTLQCRFRKISLDFTVPHEDYKGLDKALLAWPGVDHCLLRLRYHLDLHVNSKFDAKQITTEMSKYLSDLGISNQVVG